jgi:hypothetical protein
MERPVYLGDFIIKEKNTDELDWGLMLYESLFERRHGNNFAFLLSPVGTVEIPFCDVFALLCA